MRRRAPITHLVVDSLFMTAVAGFLTVYKRWSVTTLEDADGRVPSERRLTESCLVLALIKVELTALQQTLSSRGPRAVIFRSEAYRSCLGGHPRSNWGVVT